MRVRGLRIGFLGIGDEFLGSTLSGFALNPVSMNDSGQLAVRVEMADARQFILRDDPVA